MVTPLIRLRTETTPGVFTEEIAVCNQISVPRRFDSSEWEDLIGNLYASLIDGQEQLDVPVIDVQKSYLDQAHTNMVTAEHDHIIENYSLKIKNPTDKPIEVCITLSYLQEESDPNFEYGTWVILPNTRLSPKGHTLPYCPMFDMVRFKADDFVDFYNGLDLPEYLLYQGEYLGINRSTKNSFIAVDGYEPIPGDRPFGALIDINIENTTGSLANLLRVFVNSEMWWDYGLVERKQEFSLDNNHVMILKNPFDTALEVSHTFFNKPAQFAPCKNETHPDEIFVYWGTIDEVYGSEPMTTSWRIMMDGEDILHNSDNISALLAIQGASENNTNSKVDITLLTEPAADAVFLHIRNRSDDAVAFSIVKGGEEAPVDIILEPAGTVGEKMADTDGDLGSLLRHMYRKDLQVKEYKFRGKVCDHGLKTQLSLQTLQDPDSNHDFWALSPIPEKVTVTYNVFDDEGIVEGEVFEETYFIKPQPIPRFAFE